ncbi:MAG: FtsX-like permease family protein [Xanthomonadales bacterium]|nr:FtsX-like permease family protein [Xanthomonadales bacterium]
MSLRLKLSWRNIWRQRRRTLLTVSAMVFSNVLLIFSICLQLGSYDMMINNTLRTFSGHMQVQHPGYNDNPRIRDRVASVESLAAELRELGPEVDSAARASAFALVSSEERSYGAQVLGVQPLFEGDLSTIPAAVIEGRFLQDNHAPEAVVGSILARNLKCGVGDELVFLGSGADGSFAAAVVTVVGIFESGLPDLDRSTLEIPLGYFQETFAMGDSGHSVAMVAPGLEQLAITVGAVEQHLSGLDQVEVVDWEQLHPGMKQAIEADFSSGWFIYIVLIVLVSLSVMNTQLMSVLERTREFGTILALGLRPGQLAGMVVLETALMGLLGLVVGVLLGALLALYLYEVGMPMPGMEEVAAKYNLSDRIFPEVSLSSLLMGPLAVFAGCIIASLYPALRLLRMKPVEAMRAI